ncbi:hypothetical protein AABB24_007456 [Solanum stoloniferum]|uniref:Uncharacterized protein n=1 Tax=Solanum stoloniferum TaxID=62892 RepID=A0ABD2UPS7_9SOLN
MTCYLHVLFILVTCERCRSPLDSIFSCISGCLKPKPFPSQTTIKINEQVPELKEYVADWRIEKLGQRPTLYFKSRILLFFGPKSTYYYMEKLQNMANINIH